MLFWGLLALAIFATGALSKACLDRKPAWAAAWLALMCGGWGGLIAIGGAHP